MRELAADALTNRDIAQAQADAAPVDLPPFTPQVTGSSLDALSTARGLDGVLTRDEGILFAS